ncbi:hypothetical protein LCGC14_1153280 [marine sediment metagenome]|uniref:HNH nuclease domain-containing protein n=1 Tax=marine sediment metagenome TaxID=412755 RepID=A0A0F9MI19_9ZZZZ
MPHKGYKQSPSVIEKRRLAQIGRKHSNAKGWIANGRRFMMHNGKEMLEHRVVMELYIKRPLKRSEIVHHIDKNPLNNKIENLELTTKGAHSIHHNTGKIRAGQLTEEGQKRKSEYTKKRWSNGEFDNRPPLTEEIKNKISKSMKALRASRFWSSGRHKITHS